MNNVNIADQLRSTYHFDHWMQSAGGGPFGCGGCSASSECIHLYHSIPTLSSGRQTKRTSLTKINLERRFLSHGWMGIKFYPIVLINHLRV